MKNYKEQYKDLTDEEKVFRLETVIRYYAEWLNVENWRESHILDCTKFWGEFDSKNK